MQAVKLLLLHPVEQGGSPEQELVLRFPQERSERAVAVPERNLFLRVVHTGPDQYNVEALDASSAVLLSQKIEGASSLILDDLELQFTPTRHLKLSVMSRPWLWLLIPGIIFILAGLLFAGDFLTCEWEHLSVQHIQSYVGRVSKVFIPHPKK